MYIYIYIYAHTCTYTYITVWQAPQERVPARACALLIPSPPCAPPSRPSACAFKTN